MDSAVDSAAVPPQEAKLREALEAPLAAPTAAPLAHKQQQSQRR
jgi:hypothetical protein|tara:strand:- start:315 stop:446 length:132 start_codon:yes stop_codon:yes gene_type:complete